MTTNTSNTPKRVALYLRVSTGEQTTQNQRIALEAVAANHGWEIVATYQDEGISGAKGKDKRPGLAKLYAAANAREFDMVMAWSVDRLGRSLTDLLGLVEHLKAKNIGLFLHQQALDTSTPAGMAFFQMAGVFAEFERAMVVERVKAGHARARSEGRKIGRSRIEAAVEAKIVSLRATGMGKQKISKTLSIGVGTVMRVLAGEASKEAATGAT